MTTKENQPKVIVIIEGGCVQDVVHNIEDLEVTILDGDIEGCEELDSFKEFNGKVYYGYVGDVRVYNPELVNQVKEKPCT